MEYATCSNQLQPITVAKDESGFRNDDFTAFRPISIPENTPLPPGMNVLFSIERDKKSNDKGIIAVQLDPFKVLMPLNHEMFELNLPYVIAILRRPENNMALFFSKKPITNIEEENPLLACCLPHVSSISGGVCYSPNRNAQSSSLNKDNLTAIIACLQVFFSGQNKYFLDVQFPEEFLNRSPKPLLQQAFEHFIPPPQRPQYNRYNVRELFTWWDNLTSEQVMELSFPVVGDFFFILKKLATMSENQVQAWLKTFHHLERDDSINEDIRSLVRETGFENDNNNLGYL